MYTVNPFQDITDKQPSAAGLTSTGWICVLSYYIPKKRSKINMFLKSFTKMKLCLLGPVNMNDLNSIFILLLL